MSIRAAALAAALLAIAPVPQAAAAGLFDSLFGRWAAPRPAPAPMMPAPAPGHLGPGGSHLTITVTPPGMEQTFSGSSGRTYCVRTCDGRYFPLAASAGNAAELCRAMCPAAETKVFSAGTGGDMAAGVARDGTRYTRLPNAFAYRKGAVEGCSCQHGGGAGLAQIDVMSDPTLRAGDIVMTEAGPVVFRGSKRKTYSEVDFSSATLPLSPATTVRATAVRTAQVGAGAVH